MAAKKTTPNKIQQEKTRAAIQTTQLVKRLQRFALAEEGVEIDPPRLKAIEILLKKSLPDLSSVSIGNEGDEPFKVKDTGNGAAKLAAYLDAISSRAAGEPDAG